MSHPSQTIDEQAWRLIVLELFHAQESYLRAMKARDGTDAVIARAWDRVQDASRHRDEFLSGSSTHEREPKRA